jgi:DDE family transposase
MDRNIGKGVQPRESGGFSVICAEKIIELSRAIGLLEEWSRLELGHVSGRVTSYATPERVTAVLAGLACGLRGFAPGNSLLRGNTALQSALGGRFPDQGTIHRWFQQATAEQAQALRQHLHQVMRRAGRFWQAVFSGNRVVVDLDAQGLAARGARFEKAAYGHLGEGLDRGYQRFVAYAGQTREVLDEFLRPGNTMLTGELTELLNGLNEIFAAADRPRVVIRTDAHGGTFHNLQQLQAAGYGYLCRLLSRSGVRRMRDTVATTPAGHFVPGDSRVIEYWDAPQWTISGRRPKQGVVQTRAILFCDLNEGKRDYWTMLVTDMTQETPQELWAQYHQRSGTIEEYNDQSERAYHLKVLRTGSYDGLNALHALLALCWNLSVWATEDLELPPTQAPHAERCRWVRASNLDRSQLLERAAHSGLRLYRTSRTACLEVEETAFTPESKAWLKWLKQPIQHRLRLAG